MDEAAENGLGYESVIRPKSLDTLTLETKTCQLLRPS